MGGGIAALLAGAGVRTLLLDIVPFDLKDEEKNNPDACNRIVKDLFLTVFVFGMSIYGTPTLEQLIGLLKTAVPGIGISRPGFHQRINEYAVGFFEFMLSKAVRIAVYDLKLLDSFQRVIIMDSTSFQLPKNLAGIFAGSGGSASGAAVKIQFGYDLKSSSFLYISNTSEELLPKEHFRAVYGIRRQIGLVFKSWKSSFALDKVTGYREERIKCMIYAKLLFIFVTSHITHAVRNYIRLAQKREVSEFRAAQIFRISASERLRLLICEPGRVKTFLEELAGFISLQCLKIRQKDRIYPLELLEDLS